jgi:hypothetical protein
LQILAIAYLASAFRAKWQILLVSALMCLGASLNLFAHGLFTEGLAIPFLLIFLGAVLRMHRDGLTPVVAVSLVLTLVAASLTRHALLVLGGIPLAYLLLCALTSRAKRSGLLTLAQAVGLMLGVAITDGIVTRAATLMLDAQQVSILGRAGVYRIQEAYQLLPGPERDRWLETLVSRAPTPEVALALPLMAKTPNPWTGPSGAIIGEPALHGHHPDAIMNSAFKAFAVSLDPVVLRQWGNELTRAILGTGSATYCPGQVSCLWRGSAVSIATVFPADPQHQAAAIGTGAEHPETAEVYRALEVHPLVQTLDPLLPLIPSHRLLWLLGSLGLAVVAGGMTRDRGLIALLGALWLGALAYALALTVVTVVLPRYLTPIDILIWLSTAVALTALLGRARGADGSAAGRDLGTTLREPRQAT